MIANRNRGSAGSPALRFHPALVALLAILAVASVGVGFAFAQGGKPMAREPARLARLCGVVGPGGSSINRFLDREMSPQCRRGVAEWGIAPRIRVRVHRRGHRKHVSPTPPVAPQPVPPPPASPVLVDRAAPETSITAGPSGTTTATSVSFSIASSESGSSFACKLDSGAWVSCSSPSAYSGLSLGSHLFSVRATDAVGNADPTPASRSWTVSSTTPPTPGCTSTVSSVSSAQSALSSASPGQTVCLADGIYGGLSLSASKAAPGVTLAAANPGNARIGSVQVSGSGYTISRFVIDGGVTINRNVDRTVVDHNQILAGNHYGVFVCGGEPPDQCDDTAITGNYFDGAMSEDQIRANVYHDGNGDGVGLLVEGNEFRGNTERGSHNDVFQSVWVGDHLVFRKNYPGIDQGLQPRLPQRRRGGLPPGERTRRRLDAGRTALRALSAAAAARDAQTAARAPVRRGLMIGRSESRTMLTWAGAIRGRSTR
jgi:hypothetical protein